MLLQCAVDVSYWSGFNHLVVWGSIGFYFCFILAFYAEIFRYKYMGVAIRVFSTPNFWFTLVLTCAVLILPVVAYRFFYSNFRPTLADRVRLLQRSKEDEVVRLKVQRSMTHRPTYTSQRSGYAFAHQHGFGDLITTGRAMRDDLPSGAPQNGNIEAENGNLETENGNLASQNGNLMTVVESDVIGVRI